MAVELLNLVLQPSSNYGSCSVSFYKFLFCFNQLKLASDFKLATKNFDLEMFWKWSVSSELQGS